MSAQSPFLILILGGARSGKSSRAEALAMATEEPVNYVATYAKGCADAEMQDRIELHQKRRPQGWNTIEGRFDLGEIFAEAGENLVLVDCLTLWLSYQQMQELEESVILDQLEQALVKARALSRRLIVVSNEIGMGLVPSAPENRSFRDLCGRANQLVARHADTVEFVIAGLPLKLKGAN